MYGVKVVAMFFFEIFGLTKIKLDITSLNPGRSRLDQNAPEGLKTKFTHLQNQSASFHLTHKLIILLVFSVIFFPFNNLNPRGHERPFVVPSCRAHWGPFSSAFDLQGFTTILNSRGGKKLFKKICVEKLGLKKFVQ